jgi:hypothetical protein
MTKLVKPDVYEAKLLEYGLMKTKAGKPMVAIDFEFSADGEPTSLRWFGSLNEGMAREITVKTLADLGYTENTLESLAQGRGLDNGRYYYLTVVNDTYNDVTRSKIAWINLTKGSGGSGFINADEAKGLLGGMDLRADLMMATKETQRNSVPVNKITSENDHLDVPF